VGAQAMPNSMPHELGPNTNVGLVFVFLDQHGKDRPPAGVALPDVCSKKAEPGIRSAVETSHPSRLARVVEARMYANVP